MEKRFGESVDRRRQKMVIENTWHGIWRLAGLSGSPRRHASGRPTCKPNLQLAKLIEGMEVSIDVSTCDADLGIAISAPSPRR